MRSGLLALVAASVGLGSVVASCGGDGSPTDPAAGGDASPTESIVTVSGSSVVSGETAELRLEARQGGRAVRSGGATVAFHLLGGDDGASDGLIGPTVDGGDGTYTAVFTGTTAGSSVLVGATIDGDTVTTNRPSLAVTPGASDPGAADFRVSTGRLDVGSVAELRVVLRDAAGNAVGRGGAVVGFEASGGTSTGEIGATVDSGDGSYTAPFTASGVGTALDLSATADGVPIEGTATLSVVAGPVSAEHSNLSVSADVVTVGTVVQLLLQARDDQGRPLVGGGRTVEFHVTTGEGLSGGTIETDSVDLRNGTYTADFVAGKAGSPVTIGATIDGEPVGGPLPSVTVLDVEPSAQRSLVSLADSIVQAGDTTIATLQVFGPEGTPVTSGGLDVEFVIADAGGASSGEIGPVTDHGDGSYSASVRGRRAGLPVEVSATMNGDPVEMLDDFGESTLPSLTVLPGPVSLDSSFVVASEDQLALGETALLRLVSRDDFGNQLATGGLDVAFTATRDLGTEPVGTIGPVVDAGDGTYGSDYTSDEEVTALISATIAGQPIGPDPVPIAALCSPGVVSPSGSTISVATSELRSGTATTVTLQARDADGRCLRNTGLDVVFAYAGGTSTGILTSTVDGGDGSYSASLTGVVAGTPSSVTATIDGATVTSELPTVTVVPGDVSGLASVLTTDPEVLEVGQQSRVELTTYDAAGNQLTSGGLEVEFSTGGGTSTGTLTAVTDLGDGSYFAFFTAIGAGTPLTVTASVEGTPADPTPPTIEVVEPGT